MYKKFFILLLTLAASAVLFVYVMQRKTSMKKLTPYLFTQLHYPYTLPALPYAYDGLEPHFDKATMTVHHQKHHQAYIDNLNKALEAYPQYQTYTLEELIISLNTLPADLKAVVQNHGGGHYNHSMFWQILSTNFDQQPTAAIAQKIDGAFGSFDKFKEAFDKAARTVFGSGWAWLCLDQKDNMVVIATPNQDNPLAQGLRPLLGLDVWEHAYYLKFQNKRIDYIDAWWHLVNWQEVEAVYKKASAV